MGPASCRCIGLGGATDIRIFPASPGRVYIVCSAITFRPGRAAVTMTVEPLIVIVNSTASASCLLRPLRIWSAAQREAALALPAPVENLPFPELPTDADEAARQVPSTVIHAGVQGGFTLALAQRLKRRGIVCLAAASERRTRTAAGKRKLSESVFVRFRAHPSPGPLE